MQQLVQDKDGVVSDLRGELRTLLAEADAKPVMSALLDGTASAEAYIAFLVQTRHYVARTYPVLAAAGRRLHALKRHRDLADLFAQKAEEEEGHDILIDRDLLALGLDVKAALADGPGPWIRAYNTWIDAVSRGEYPAGFLGSAYILEGLAVERGARVADALRASSKIKNVQMALSFLDLHAVADIGHVDDLERILDRLDDGREREAIALTASVTREAYLGMLDDIMAMSTSAVH